MEYFYLGVGPEILNPSKFSAWQGTWKNMQKKGLNKGTAGNPNRHDFLVIFITQTIGRVGELPEKNWAGKEITRQKMASFIVHTS